MSPGKNLNKTKGILKKLLFRPLHIQFWKIVTVDLALLFCLPPSRKLKCHKVNIRLKKMNFREKNYLLCNSSILYLLDTEVYAH